MTQKLQIYSLNITVSSKTMVSIQPNKVGQVNVEWYINT